MSDWQQHITYDYPNAGSGVIRITIKVSSYHLTGAHWRDTLSGKRAKRWGRLYIDPDVAEARQRRADSLYATKGLYAGYPEVNMDECPGAMFVTEHNVTSDVASVDAYSNQKLGRDLYQALRAAIRDAPPPKSAATTPAAPGKRTRVTRPSMDWWQVEFKFR